MTTPGGVATSAIRGVDYPRLMYEGVALAVVQELLGHSSLSTTQIYSHVSAKRLRRVYDRAHPRS